jgi:hypothetical protein
MSLNLQCKQYGHLLLTHPHKVFNCQHTTITMSHDLQCTQYGHFLLTYSHKVSKCQHTKNHNVTKFTVCKVWSLPADPLTLLHKVSTCHHTTIIMSHNLQCTRYCHFLLTHSHSCTKCPPAITQQSQCHTIYSVHSTVTFRWTTHTPAQIVYLPSHNNHNVTQFTVYTVQSLSAEPLTLLHQLSTCQHTKIILLHNLQYTQYGHLLLTHSHSCAKCPTVNIQQS